MPKGINKMYRLNHFKLPATIECTIPETNAIPILYLRTIGNLNDNLRERASISDYPYFFGLYKKFQYTTIFNYLIVLFNLYNLLKYYGLRRISCEERFERKTKQEEME